MACEFNALADLEELQIKRSPDTPNTRLQIRLELQINSELEPPDRFNPKPNTSLDFWIANHANPRAGEFLK